jgi:hypothetical protein
VSRTTDDQDASADRADAPPPPKKPYTAPQLVEYGSVARLTAAKSGTPNDAGMPMNVCL